MNAADSKIRIQIKADRSQDEAERLLREGGEVRSRDVLLRLMPMIYDFENSRPLREDVVFWRVCDDGDIREFCCDSVACAIDQQMDIRPSEDLSMEEAARRRHERKQAFKVPA